MFLQETRSPCIPRFSYLQFLGTCGCLVGIRAYGAQFAIVFIIQTCPREEGRVGWIVVAGDLCVFLSCFLILSRWSLEFPESNSALESYDRILL